MQYGFRFKAPQYIPSCKLQVYANNTVESSRKSMLGRFIGESATVEKQNRQQVTLLLGISTTVVVQTVVRNQRDETNRLHTDFVRCKIENTNSISVTLILKHKLNSQDPIISVRTFLQNATVDHSSTQIAWTIVIRPSTSLHFEADIVFRLQNTN